MQKTLFESIVSAFEGKRDNVRAAKMKAYMKDQYEYFGLTSPIRKETQTKVIKENPGLFISLDLKSFVKSCWSHPCREMQYVAMDIMRRKKKDLEQESDIPFLLELVCMKSWWDTVDFLASFHIGVIFRNHPDLKETYIKLWMQDGDMWVRRTAILSQLKLKEQTDFDLLKTCILITAHEKEFFIRKASGWALREYSKTNAPAVIDFVKDNENVLSGLTRREALKWLERKGKQ